MAKPQFDTPALVLDLDRLEANIAEMARACTQAGVRLRPHTKTHKMPEIAKLQVAAGAQGITCAKLGEAEVMANAGIDDILIAYPIWGDEKLRRLAQLRERARVIVSLDSIEVAEGLSRFSTDHDPLEIYFEIDTGQHRMGLPPTAQTAELIARVNDLSALKVIGLMTHAGHAYKARTEDEAQSVVLRELEDLTSVQLRCLDLGVPLTELSVGSTPSVRRELSIAGITEVRPGTYVFNDTTMMDLGVAKEETCALHVVATVVSRPSDNRFVVDAGTKSLTSDGVGRANWIKIRNRADLAMEFLSEEHGVGTLLENSGSLKIGDQLELIPSHACPVVNLFDEVLLLRAGSVVDHWRVAGRGKSQ